MNAGAIVSRIILMAVSAGVAVTLAEGAWSLATRDSLLFPSPIVRIDMLDEERVAAAALTEGPFAIDEDPIVGLRTKPSLTRDFWNVPATTDVFGMRVRDGGALRPEAQSIAILGDSYAFGFGVADGDTLGNQLEKILATAFAADAIPPDVHTVACTGWNFRQQARYMRNHLARIDPSVVVMLPVGNDLDDSYQVSETGHRWIGPRTSGPFVGVEYYGAFVAIIAQRTRAFVAEQWTWPLLLTDLSPESRRRWDGYVAGIRDLQDRMRARGGALVVAYPDHDPFQLVLRKRLSQALPELPQVGLIGPRTRDDCIEGDPHPNASWYRASARVLAERLIKEGLIPGADATRLPAIELDYAERQFDIEQWRLEPVIENAWDVVYAGVIDLGEPVVGFQQIYGGVDALDGTVGLGCFVGLRKAGARSIELRVERLAAESGLYPCSIRVAVEGEQVGAQAVPAPRSGDDPKIELSFALPRHLADRAGKGLDLMIAPDNWIADRSTGRTRQSAFRLVRVEMK